MAAAGEAVEMAAAGEAVVRIDGKTANHGLVVSMDCKRTKETEAAIPAIPAAAAATNSATPNDETFERWRCRACVQLTYTQMAAALKTAVPVDGKTSKDPAVAAKSVAGTPTTTAKPVAAIPAVVTKSAATLNETFERWRCRACAQLTRHIRDAQYEHSVCYGYSRRQDDRKSEWPRVGASCEARQRQQRYDIAAHRLKVLSCDVYLAASLPDARTWLEEPVFAAMVQARLDAIIAWRDGPLSSDLARDAPLPTDVGGKCGLSGGGGTTLAAASNGSGATTLSAVATTEKDSAGFEPMLDGRKVIDNGEIKTWLISQLLMCRQKQQPTDAHAAVQAATALVNDISNCLPVGLGNLGATLHIIADMLYQADCATTCKCIGEDGFRRCSCLNKKNTQPCYTSCAGCCRTTHDLDWLWSALFPHLRNGLYIFAGVDGEALSRRLLTATLT